MSKRKAETELENPAKKRIDDKEIEDLDKPIDGDEECDELAKYYMSYEDEAECEDMACSYFDCQLKRDMSIYRKGQELYQVVFDFKQGRLKVLETEDDDEFKEFELRLTFGKEIMEPALSPEVE